MRRVGVWLLLACLLAAGPAQGGEPEFFLGGHARAQGIWSQVPADSYLRPVGVGDYQDGQGQVRLKGEARVGSQGLFQVHYELNAQGGDTWRRGRRLGNIAFGDPAGRVLDDDRRLFNLTGIIEDQPGYLIYHRLDRLLFSWRPSWGSLTLGRQALTWGHGLVFNPMDLCNPFAPSDFLRDYKVGDDMALLSAPLPGGAELQLLAVPRRDPLSAEVDSEFSSLAGKLHFTMGGVELDLMAARHFRDLVAGAGAVGYVGQAAWRLDAVLTRLTGDGQEASLVSLVANLDYSWVWAGYNFYGLAEFYYNGLGSGDYARAWQEPALAQRLERGEVFTLGRTYLALSMQWELHPLVNLHGNLICNLADPSGLFQPRLVWDASQNTQIMLGANLYFGAPGSEYGGFALERGGLDLEPAPSLYLLATWFF